MSINHMDNKLRVLKTTSFVNEFSVTTHVYKLLLPI